MKKESLSSKEKAKQFLSQAEQFQLGNLVTESINPLTVGLSQMVKLNLSEAINSFVKVDEEMLNALAKNGEGILKLSQNIQNCFKRGKTVYLSGCGATGRLSLTIENIWRRTQKDRDKVKAFMAGGDLALIHSIEKFEDFPELGARQLREMGFESGDLLLASTEGGETPWVIGTALEAIKLGGECTFLYCNPDELLKGKLKRCQVVLNDPQIKKLNLTSGPQALTGSTRLQASTILMAAISIALFENPKAEDIDTAVHLLKDWYLNLNHLHLRRLIESEANLYRHGKGLYYLADEALAISVLTDTTERSPTFSLMGFDNKNDLDSKASWVYLAMSSAPDGENAWDRLLQRAPKTLEWNDVVEKAGERRLYGFDFSREVFRWRKKRTPSFGKFHINQKSDSLLFELEGDQAFFQLPNGHLYQTHLILKMLLNMHSTLLMGLMGRYESNVMTYVRPSNYKLIDRCVRYAEHLLKQKGKSISYDELVQKTCELMESNTQDEPIVIKIVESIC